MEKGIIVLIVILILLLIVAFIIFAMYYQTQINNQPDCKNQDWNCPICPIVPIKPTYTPPPIPSSCSIQQCDNTSYCTNGRVSSGLAWYQGPSAQCSSVSQNCLDNNYLCFEETKGAYSCDKITLQDQCEALINNDIKIKDYCPVTCNSCPSNPSSIPSETPSESPSESPSDIENFTPPTNDLPHASKDTRSSKICIPMGKVGDSDAEWMACHERTHRNDGHIPTPTG